MFHSYRRKRSGLGGETFAGVTSKPGGGILLDCSRSRVYRIQAGIVQYLYYESAYKGHGVTHVRGSGSVHRGCTSAGTDARVCSTVRARVSVRLKLAFCMTCAVRVLVLAQGPSFLRLRRALLRRRGDSQDERSATITSGGVETIQRSCSTSTEENEVV